MSNFVFRDIEIAFLQADEYHPTLLSGINNKKGKSFEITLIKFLGS
jgi:hypothetical protein